MKIKVSKKTDISLMREACEMTFIGKSKMTLGKMTMCEHSPLRTQTYWVQLYEIPLFASTQLLRHHVGSQPFQLSCRPDRKGGNVHFKARIDRIINLVRDGGIEEAISELMWLQDNADRYTKVNLGLCLNAQALINMAKDRLCSDASTETREIFKGIKAEIAKIEPELVPYLVRKCVYRGGICNSLCPCGYNKSAAGKAEIEEYKTLFSI
ncbi:MAG: FAD-dependent thymidylate synthase [Muribaculum sp.]|nr:FAD-dependent thymidylate synthase [Muribaculum sp.]